MAEQEPVNIDALSDLRTPWCVHVVATLRIADHIATGLTDLDDLATAAACDSDSLSRVLRHLVRKGVFQELTPGQFTLNDAANDLLDPSRRLGFDLDGIGGRMAHAWSTLLPAVRTGKPAYDAVFGRPFWEDLDAHPDIAASFDTLMGAVGHGTPDPELLVNSDWESVKTIVDVGGGTGDLLTEILLAHPEIRGTLVDLPRTVARASEYLHAAGVAERVTLVGQSFFDPLPAGADLYVLQRVLNDWPDRETISILRRCAEAVQPSGRVVVLGGVISDDARSDLEPELVLLGGKNNTVSEFREIAHLAGLDITHVGKQRSGRLVIECRQIQNPLPVA